MEKVSPVKKLIEITIKSEIDMLSNLILKNSGVYRDYSNEEMSNATIIFMEVFLAKMFDKHKKKLTMPQLENLSKEAGKSLYQTIQLFTGVDLKKVYKKK